MGNIVFATVSTLAMSSADNATQDIVHVSEPLQVFWFPGKPADDAIESRLLRALTTHGLLLEPFERAAIGLREVYRATPSP